MQRRSFLRGVLAALVAPAAVVKAVIDAASSTRPVRRTLHYRWHVTSEAELRTIYGSPGLENNLVESISAEMIECLAKWREDCYGKVQEAAEGRGRNAVVQER